RHLAKHPELRFHPIFNWFEQWCNDEFRHGEAFALLMRNDPKLLQGHNRLWIKFFLMAVYATMYVRDHNRPSFHAALGVDPTDYDYQVFDICSAISKQVFPLTVDSNAPAFRRGMERMRKISNAMDAAGAQGGIIGRVKKLALTAAAGATFVRMLFIPAQRNALPAQVRLVPAW
ncbi:MAG: magnesium-protoporphyrin IX monomethyl ester (oxidative) cyclase, partial [Sphingomonas sp.]|nr:magnesium-protoporphyrin IX monomethyl ester (oxidative) cyclase [Sphingomonas sp.]